MAVSVRTSYSQADPLHMDKGFNVAMFLDSNRVGDRSIHSLNHSLLPTSQLPASS